MEDKRKRRNSRINIDVTNDDIARAHISDSYKCVVAQAVARTLPDATRIEVDVATIRFTRDEKRFVYLTPFIVQGYVVAFDAGEPIAPFRFQLRDPQQVRRRVTVKPITDDEPPAEFVAIPLAPPTAQPVTVTPTEPVTVTPTETVDTVEGSYRESVRHYDDLSLPKAPPRIHKKKSRSYGHRLLRVNRNS